MSIREIIKKNNQILSVITILITKSVLLLYAVYSIDQSMLLYSLYSTITPVVLLISISFLFSNKNKTIYLISIDLLVSLLFLADLIYARAFGHFISLYMILAKGVTEDLGLSIVSLVKWTDFLLFIDIPVLMYILKPVMEKSDLKSKLFKFTVVFLSTASIICYQFVHIEDTQATGNASIIPIVMSPIGYHMCDLYRYKYENNIELTNKEVSEIQEWLNQNSIYQEADNQYSQYHGLLKGKNIVVIQVESLENILIGQSYFRHEITPNINRLLANSIYFENIHDQVRDGNSADAEFMFNTSIYPLSEGSAFVRFGTNTYITLPHLLSDAGYHTLAIHGDNKEYWNRDVVFSAFGYDDYIARDRFSFTSEGGMGILDECLFKQCMFEINRSLEPFFLFTITLSSHAPFNIAEQIKPLSLEENGYTSRYLETISYVDNCLGQFLEQLDSKVCLNNTAIIIYGDHEGVHKYYDTNLPDNNTEIPFIVYVPGMQGIRFNTIGGQVDIMPTLAYLLGIPGVEYEKAVMGVNLFSRYSGAAILSNGNLLGDIHDEAHLRTSQDIADLIVRGNYFQIYTKK